MEMKHLGQFYNLSGYRAPISLQICTEKPNVIFFLQFFFFDENRNSSNTVIITKLQ
jgi:hypothetical protein